MNQWQNSRRLNAEPWMVSFGTDDSQYLRAQESDFARATLTTIVSQQKHCRLITVSWMQMKTWNCSAVVQIHDAVVQESRQGCDSDCLNLLRIALIKCLKEEGLRCFL